MSSAPYTGTRFISGCDRDLGFATAFVQSAGVLAAEIASGIPRTASAQAACEAAESAAHTINMAVSVNDKAQQLAIDSRTTLYTQTADRFGWSKRNAKPDRVIQGNNQIGYGMATATYGANRSAAQAVVQILLNGRAFVGCGSQDLGTGAYTIGWRR